MTSFATKYSFRLAAIGIMCLCTMAGLGCDTQNGDHGDSAIGTGSGKSQEHRNTPVSDADRQFILKVASGGDLEVDLGRIASERAASSDVKSFANKMIQDHSKAGDELKQLASKLNVSIPTATSDVSANAIKNNLLTLSSPQFDRTYMNQMVKDHSEVVSKFEEFVTGGQNSDLKAWATKTLPVIREHLAMAKSINDKLGMMH